MFLKTHKIKEISQNLNPRFNKVAFYSLYLECDVTINGEKDVYLLSLDIIDINIHNQIATIGLLFAFPLYHLLKNSSFFLLSSAF